jgi:hypothetical protein
MAFQTLRGGIETCNIAFEDLQFVSPLGLNWQREASLRLEESQSGQSWKIRGQLSINKVSRRVLNPLHWYHHVTSKRISLDLWTVRGWQYRPLYSSDNIERHMAKRAYGLFTKVIYYAPFFKGISPMAVDGNETVAIIKLPDDQPGREESLVWRRCDTVLIDAFISVVGLLLNSSDEASNDEVITASGIERVVLTAAC